MRQYPIMNEPEDFEFKAFAKVLRFYEQMEVAEFLEGRAEVSPEEFDELVERLHDADFGAERSDFLAYELELIEGSRE